MSETVGVDASASLGSSFAEQQAYISERDGRIGWMRTLCSGYRPVEGE
jgi:hypothetical protein